MKYVSRVDCVGRGALGGVLKEVELLASLEHPFLVNLWFSFQGKIIFLLAFSFLMLYLLRIFADENFFILLFL